MAKTLISMVAWAVLGLVPPALAVEGAVVERTAWSRAKAKDRSREVAAPLARAREAEKAGDFVEAYLLVREAQRLEQLFSGNTAGDDSLASRAMTRLVGRLVAREDQALIKVLHSPRIPLPSKLSLLKSLEADIILRYPGAHSDELLQSLNE